MTDPFRPRNSEADEIARREAYQRIAEAARRLGLPLERLSSALREVARNEQETRRFLSEVYGVPDELLDDLVRLRLSEPDQE